MVTLLPIILIVLGLLLFLAKYINPRIPFGKTLIQSYVIAIGVCFLIGMAFIYPKASNAVIEKEVSPLQSLEYFPSILEIPDDYIRESFEISEPVEVLDITLGEMKSEMGPWPVFYVEKDPERTSIEIIRYESPPLFNGIDLSAYFPEMKIELEADELLVSTDELVQVKKNFHEITMDPYTAQFTSDRKDNSDIYANYDGSQIYLLIRAPEDLEIRNEDDIFNIHNVNPGQ